MDGPADLFAGQSCDHPFDLPPVTKARDIAEIAAALGPRGGLESGVVAETLDQLVGVGEREAAMDEGRVHVRDRKPRPVSRLRTIAVNDPLTIFRGAAASGMAPA